MISTTILNVEWAEKSIGKINIVKYHGSGDPWLPDLAGDTRSGVTAALEFNSARTPGAVRRRSCGTTNTRTHSPRNAAIGSLSLPRQSSLSETNIPSVRLPPVGGRRPWASAPSLRARLSKGQHKAFSDADNLVPLNCTD